MIWNDSLTPYGLDNKYAASRRHVLSYPNVPDGRADYHLPLNYNVIVPNP
jgi:hypothetical protein